MAEGRMTTAADGPPAELRFRVHVRPRAALRELWQSRLLVRTLAERELRARYKQTVIGFAWALVTPMALMVAFTFFLNRFAKVPTRGIPYPLFAYIGLIPWTFFASSLSAGASSLLANTSLMNKVYCPREVFPLSCVVVAGIDSATATLGLVVLFAVFRVGPTVQAVWVPVLLAVQVAFTVGLTLLLSAAIVYIRDIRHVMTLIIQFGLFATPVAYGLDKLSASLRPVYSALYPLAPVIDGYRRTVLFGQSPEWRLLMPGATTATVVLVLGYLIFKRLEGGVADVA